MAPPKKDASEPSPGSLFHSFAPLLDAATDGIHILDPQGTLVAASRSFFEVLGYAPEELLGSHVSAWDARFTSSELADLIARTLALPPNGSFAFESLHRKKDGSTFPVEIHAAFLPLEERRFCFYSSRDIADRLAGERRLRELTEFTELLAKVNGKIALAHDRETFFQVSTQPPLRHLKIVEWFLTFWGGDWTSSQHSATIGARANPYHPRMRFDGRTSLHSPT